ncbi:MAG: complex I NDUFA9 subunit family protein [Clostridia bacterium]
MRVAVTGANGYVGQAVVEALLADGHEVIAVSRHPRLTDRVHGLALDVTRDDLRPALQGTDAVVHLIGIIRENRGAGITFERLHIEATRRVLESARQLNVGRLIHMSALGTSARGGSAYFETKWAAEQAVRSSWPHATIIRPSLMFGGGADFFRTLAGLARKPVVPVPGDGQTPFDPVARSDVARVIAAMVSDDSVRGETYEVGGPERLSLNQLIDRVGSALGRSTPLPKMHIPVGALRPLVSLGERMPAFPLTRDQLAMLRIPNITDDTRWHRWVNEPARLGRDL